MTLYNGQSYSLLNIPGLIDYGARLDNNFVITETAVNNLKSIIDLLSAGGHVDAADAGLNVPNLLINGDFALGFCAPSFEASAANQVIIPTQNTYGQKLVRWADLWWYEEDALDGLDVQSLVLVAKPPLEWADPQDGIAIFRGTGTGPYTGRIYQRVDYFNDLTNIRNKMISFAVEYTSVTDNEFYLEIDDGVTTTNNQLVIGGPSPAAVRGVSRLQHFVDPAATKLTVSIVVQVDAPVNPADAIRIHRAYARIGVGVITIPTHVPPSQFERDLFCAKTVTKFIEFGSHLIGFPWIVSGSFDMFGSTETYSSVHWFDSPFIWIDFSTVTATFYAQPSADPRDITLLSNPPQISPLAGRRPLINRKVGDNLGTYGRFDGVMLTVERTPADLPIAPATGFYSQYFGFGVTAIPQP